MIATRIKPGKYMARALSWGFGATGTGKEQIGVLFEVQTGGEPARLPWYGFFHDEAAAKRAMSSMRACGWNGEGPVTEAQGLDEKDVQVVVEDDEYNGETKSRIAWVNSVGVALKPLDASRKASLNDRVAQWQKKGASAPRKAPPPNNNAPSGVRTQHSARPVGGSWVPVEQFDDDDDDDIPF